MSTLETNAIGKYSGDNVSVDDSLNLKSYTTTARNALTSVAGDMIYNTTDSKVQVYNGSSWDDLGGLAAFSIEYVIQAGGGGGGAGRIGTGNYSGEKYNGGGAGAGGYNTNVIGDNSGGITSAENPFGLFTGYNYTVTVGAGGSGRNANTEARGYTGTNSIFGDNLATGGGAGSSRNSGGSVDGGCGGGVGGGIYGGAVNEGIAGEGKGGGYSVKSGSNNYTFGAGGGTGGNGGNTNQNDTDNNPGGNGGIGTISTILTTSEATTASVGEVDGSNVYFGGGGGAGNSGTGGLGGAGNGGAYQNGAGTNATANTGGGGGGGAGGSTGGASGNGGSGLVILRYPDAYTITVGAGLTSSTITQGSSKVTIFTQGTGTISFS